MTDYPRVLPVGDSALTLELGDRIDPALNARVRALDQALAERSLSGLVEAVPSYRSLLVRYDPRKTDFAGLAAELLERAGRPGAVAPAGRRHMIPTRYGGEDGPDLAPVARSLGLSEGELMRLHAAQEQTAFMLGFMPGFAYLGLLPESLETPRRATPRTRVPRGSVAVAGRQSGIYPASSPGGWNLIGRTNLALFDPWADSPSLILPGDLVRFVSVDELPLEPERTGRQEPGLGSAAIEVLDGGLLTTVQDAGRVGYARLGVGRAGPLDREALAAANRAAGNPLDAAGLEATVGGPTLRFLAPTLFAIAGAELGALLERTDLGPWPVPLGRKVLARAGSVLRFEGRRHGCRAYLAFAGGLAVAHVLGSKSTDLGGGFGGLGGRALRAGDLLRLGPAPGQAPEPPPTPEPPAGEARLRVVLGPQDDHFTPDAVTRFLSEPFVVSEASDRVGFRLRGPRLAHCGRAEIVTDGMVPGCVQVPPDGQPIVMMADGPPTGGYPKIATVLSTDLGRLAQLAPGESVRFEAVSVEQAHAELRGSRE